MRGGGKAVFAALERDPELITMWGEYEACRALQWVTFRRPEGETKEVQVSVAWPSHFATLPFEGGWADQPYFYTRIFTAFLAGEREGVIERMNN